MHITSLKADWTLHRKRFILGNADHKLFEARVDGFLRRRLTASNFPADTDPEALAIIEVKPYIRSKKLAAIQMQEAGQMAAWIANYPPSNLSDLRRSGKLTSLVSGPYVADHRS